MVDDHPKLAFAVPSGLMLVAAAVLVWQVRDSRSAAYQAALAEDEASAATGQREANAEVQAGPSSATWCAIPTGAGCC